MRRLKIMTEGAPMASGVVAGMMKTLNYVNMFNHGIGEVQDLLRANENPEAVFNIGYLTAFSVVVKDEEETNCSPTVHQLALNLPVQVKSLIQSLKEEKMSVPELKLVTNCSPNSKQLFIKQFIVPALEVGLIERTHPENPHHPQQKYYLTELGLEVLRVLTRQQEDSGK